MEFRNDLDISLLCSGSSPWRQAVTVELTECSEARVSNLSWKNFAAACCTCWIEASARESPADDDGTTKLLDPRTAFLVSSVFDLQQWSICGKSY